MKPKKRMRFIVLAVIALLVVAVALVGRQYYQDRYVSSDYYTMVPLGYDVTPEMIKTMDGEDMGLGKEYTLTVYSPQGEPREVSFNVFAPGSGWAGARPLPQPGDYLLVKASKTIVTGWSTITLDAIPKAVLQKLS